MTEPEIIANDEIPDTEIADEQLGDEALGGNLRIRFVESHAQHAADTGRGQRFVLLTETGETSRRFVAAEKFLRCGLENHDQRRHAVAARFFEQAREHCSMTEVYTVEIADRRHASEVARAKIV